MSRKGSKRNRDNKKSKDDDRYTRQGNGTNNGNEELSAVTFKYPGRFATLTRTILLNENLTIKELQRKITLSASQQPPDAKSIFISYYMDEIFPFINKHAQETINTKKSIEKSWDLQTNHFQKIYVKRSEMLRQKWMEMRNGKTSSSSHSNGHHHSNYSNGSSSSHSNAHSSTYTVTNHHHHYNKLDKKNANDDESGEGISDSTTVIFKYYSVHSSAKTNRHIFIKSPTKKELLNKIKLSINNNPPNAKELFEIYYYDEILPFLKKSGQQSIRGKKDLSKVWQIQTKTFKNLYEERAKILMEEWLKMKKENKKSKKSRNSNDHRRDSMDEKKSSLKTPKNGHQKKMSFPSHSPSMNGKQINGEYSTSSPKSSSSSSHIKMEKIECSLIRTLLNFLLFVEGTTKENCFMLLINNQNERHSEYNKFESYLRKIGRLEERKELKDKKDDKKDDKGDLVYFHLRVYVDNFDQSHLRLHTGKQVIKLCFVNDFEQKDMKQIKEEEELILFELRFNKLIAGLEDKIDHEHIEANLDEETRILSINVPLY